MIEIRQNLKLKLTKEARHQVEEEKFFVQFQIQKKLRPALALEQGKIRRIRGTAYSTRVSPQTPGRIVEAARSILNQFLPDVFIFADVAKGQAAGKSAGFGVALVAESTNENVKISAEVMSKQKGEKQISAEDIGIQAALQLLEELNLCGVCDSISQPLMILFCALNQSDVSKILCGKLTSYSIELLRNMKLF